MRSNILSRKHEKTAASESNPAAHEEDNAEVQSAEAEKVETGAEQPVEPTPAEKLGQELLAAQTEAARNWDLYLRERADLENFRKRTQREKQEAIRFANDQLLKEMVPVLDNLERAVEHASQQGEEQQGLLEGVNMTITLFNKVLSDFGVTVITSVGQAFDPNLHQAMGQIETNDQPPNSVVSEFQKGYLLNDRLLRPALVMVAKTPTAGSDPAEKGEAS